MKKKLISKSVLSVKEYADTVLEIKARVQDAQARGFASLKYAYQPEKLDHW